MSRDGAAADENWPRTSRRRRVDAYRDYVSARERTVDFLITLVPRANDLPTAAQRRRIPTQISNYLDRRVLEFLRTSTLGDASAVAR